MENIIYIKDSFEVGKILAKIKKSDKENITLRVESKSSFNRLKDNYKMIKDYAEENNKNINIETTERFEKVGFVPGEDITKQSPNKKETKDSNGHKKENSSKIPKLALPSLSLPLGRLKDKKLFIILTSIIGLLLLIGSGAVAAYYYLPKAEVNISIDSQVFTGSKEVTTSTEAEEISINDKVIPGTLISVTLTEDRTEIPTGEKETGEKATGSVKIFNKTEEEITLESGTSLVYEKSNLEYLLNEEVTISEKTENEEGTGEVFGSSVVEVTASSFGEEYDMENDSQVLTIADYETDELDAKLESDITGGTSEKVTIATEEDLEKLEEDTMKELNEKAVESLKEKTVAGQEVVTGGIKTNITNKTFDTEAGEETDKINLKLEATATTIAYSKEDLLKVLDEIIQDLIPENYSLAENKEKVSINTTSKEIITNEQGVPTQLLLNNKIQSFVIPKIEENKIKQNISNLTINEANSYLSEVANIRKSEIALDPALPGPLRRIPRNTNNITINIEANQ